MGAPREPTDSEKQDAKEGGEVTFMAADAGTGQRR